MARRRAVSPRRLILYALLVVAGGVAAGMLLSRGPLDRAPAPTPAPVPPPPAARPQPPEPEVVSVDDAALNAAVSAVFLGLGAGQRGEGVTRETAVPQSTQAGSVTLRWQSRSIDLRSRHTPAQVARALEPEVTRAGGRVVLQGGTITVEVERRGTRLRTHLIRVSRPASTARVAIIFDDAGGSLEDIEVIIALQRPVTIAVLPGLRFSRDVAERTRAAGLEVFLHLPLEPEDASKALGPGGITGGMSDAEIAATVRAGLASVPGAVGVNNHMGSKGTADERVMRAVLGVVKEEGLIWVDSVTSPRTVGGRLAADLGIHTAARHVFLDNEDEVEAIRAQLRRLIQVAGAQGEAVAIGHAHRRTAQVLGDMLGEFDKAGIELVPASALAR